MIRHFSLSHTTRQAPPRLPYERMKDDILGKNYTLSLVFVGNARSRVLNQKYRNKTYPPNVLSFPLSDTTGEVYINPHRAARDAKKFDLSTRGMIAFLFIHALLHLKGLDHGDTMERAEQRFLKKYDLS